MSCPLLLHAYGRKAGNSHFLWGMFLQRLQTKFSPSALPFRTALIVFNAKFDNNDHRQNMIMTHSINLLERSPGFQLTSDFLYRYIFLTVAVKWPLCTHTHTEESERWRYTRSRWSSLWCGRWQRTGEWLSLVKVTQQQLLRLLNIIFLLQLVSLGLCRWVTQTVYIYYKMFSFCAHQDAWHIPGVEYSIQSRDP